MRRCSRHGAHIRIYAQPYQFSRLQQQGFHFATGKTSFVGEATGPIAREAPCLSATRDGHAILWTQTDHADSDLVLLEHFR
jgi:hypothetical protein